MAWLFIGMLCLIPLILVSTYYDIEKLQIEKQVISAAEHYHMLWVFLVGFMAILTANILLIISQYYEEKKRKDWN